jgi:hypothetical protein
MRFELIEDETKLVADEAAHFVVEENRILPVDILENVEQQNNKNAEENNLDHDGTIDSPVKARDILPETFAANIESSKKKNLVFQSNDNLILNNSFSFDQDQNPLFKDYNSGVNSLRKSFKEDSIYDEKKVIITNADSGKKGGTGGSFDQGKAWGKFGEEIKVPQEPEKKKVEVDQQTLQEINNRFGYFRDQENNGELGDLREKIR